MTEVRSESRFWTRCALFVGAAVGMSFWASSRLQGGRFAIHWDVQGNPDGYSGEIAILWGVPAVMLVLSLILSLAPRVDPAKLSHLQARRAYNLMTSSVLAFMLATHVGLLLLATGYTLDMLRYLGLWFGLLLLAVGFSLGQMQTSHAMGFRTPWTRRSELAWRRTHQAARTGLMALGGAVLAANLAGLGPWVLPVLGCLLLWVVSLLIYSYVVWRGDPQRRP